MMFEVIHKH